MVVGCARGRWQRHWEKQGEEDSRETREHSE